MAVDHVSPQAIRSAGSGQRVLRRKLRGSYELDPTKTAFSDTADAEHELWRVVEIAPVVNAQGVTDGLRRDPAASPGSSPGQPRYRR